MGPFTERMAAGEVQTFNSISTAVKVILSPPAKFVSFLTYKEIIRL